MVEVIASSFFIQSRHFVAEADTLVEMTKKRAAQSGCELVVSSEDEDHRIVGVHFEVEEHRQLDEGFGREVVSVIENEEGQLSGGGSAVADGGLKIQNS